VEEETGEKAMATPVTPIRDLKGYLEPEQVEKIIARATRWQKRRKRR